MIHGNADDERRDDEELRDKANAPSDLTPQGTDPKAAADRPEQSVTQGEPVPQTSTDGSDVDGIPGNLNQGARADSREDSGSVSSDDLEETPTASNASHAVESAGVFAGRSESSQAPSTIPDGGMSGVSQFIPVEPSPQPLQIRVLHAAEQIDDDDRSGADNARSSDESAITDSPWPDESAERSNGSAATEIPRGQEGLYLPFRLEVTVADLLPLVREAIHLSAQEINQGLDARQRDMQREMEYSWRTELRLLFS